MAGWNFYFFQCRALGFAVKEDLNLSRSIMGAWFRRTTIYRLLFNFQRDGLVSFGLKMCQPLFVYIHDLTVDRKLCLRWQNNNLVGKELFNHLGFSSENWLLQICNSDNNRTNGSSVGEKELINFFFSKTYSMSCLNNFEIMLQCSLLIMIVNSICIVLISSKLTDDNISQSITYFKSIWKRRNVFK